MSRILATKGTSITRHLLPGLSDWESLLLVVETHAHSFVFLTGRRLGLHVTTATVRFTKQVCVEKYTVSHILSCKKGGFVAWRYDSVINLLTSFLGNVCANVEVEPQLQPLDNDRLNLRSAVTS